MKDDQGEGLVEDRGDVGCETWCSRGPCRGPRRGSRRALVTATIRWADAHTWTIGGPAWMVVGLHALHTSPVRTALVCCEGYRPGGHGGAHVMGPLLMTSEMEFGNSPIG